MSSFTSAKTDVAATLKDIDASTPGDNTLTRQQNQDDAMKKLTGQDTSLRSPNVVIQPTKPPPSGTSLAAFMGSKATGPRLTRHAPQQNAHDPTQFEQRTVTHITAPHPIFGRGGVAMPGMTPDSGRMPSSVPRSGPTTIQPPSFSSSSESEQPVQRDRTTSTPSGVRSIVAKAEERRPVSPQKTGSVYDGGLSARQRTMSTPTGSFPPRTPTTPTPQPKVEDPQPTRFNGRPVSRSPAPTSGGHTPLRPTTPRDRPKPLDKPSTPQPAYSVPPPRSPIAPSQSASIPPRSPSIPHPSVHQSPSSAKSLVTTPSLSRPIQPQPRPSFGGPQVSISPSSSAAFLRAPSAEKEPTPSISRLQGRGFVQSVVKASSQLTAAATGSPISRQTAGTPDAGKKSSVLDRWQFENGKSGGMPSPPIISPKPVQMRKSKTFDPQSPSTSASPVPTPFLPDAHSRGMRSAPVLPSISQPGTPDLPAVRLSSSRSDVGAIPPSRPKSAAGSSNTSISYMKPTKTGDNPPVISAPSTPAPQAKTTHTPTVDEMGVRIRPRAKSISAGVSEEVGQGQGRASLASGDSDSGKPLSHVRSFW